MKKYGSVQIVREFKEYKLYTSKNINFISCIERNRFRRAEVPNDVKLGLLGVDNQTFVDSICNYLDMKKSIGSPYYYETEI